MISVIICLPIGGTRVRLGLEYIKVTLNQSCKRYLEGRDVFTVLTISSQPRGITLGKVSSWWAVRRQSSPCCRDRSALCWRHCHLHMDLPLSVQHVAKTVSSPLDHHPFLHFLLRQHQEPLYGPCPLVPHPSDFPEAFPA